MKCLIVFLDIYFKCMSFILLNFNKIVLRVFIFLGKVLVIIFFYLIFIENVLLFIKNIFKFGILLVIR